MADLSILLIFISSLSSALCISDVYIDNSYTLPEGHPDRCILMLSGNKDIHRLEALPGAGWDNLRNKDMGTVVQHTYKKCRTTEDGRFLLPDSITTIPIKTSGVDTVAEYFDHWDSYTSVSAFSINSEVEICGLPIGGKFSQEYESMKTKQYSENSFITRMQVSVSIVDIKHI